MTGRNVCRLAAVLVCWGAWSSTGAFAVEWRSERFKCTLSIPDGVGWEIDEALPAEHHVLMLRIAEPARVVNLIVVPLEKGVYLGGGFKKGIKKGMQKTGAKLVAEQEVVLGGISAYEVRSIQDIEGQEVRSLNRFAIANGSSYGLSALKPGADPAEDPEIMKVVEGFSFIGTPEVPEKGEDEDISYRIGQLAGYVLVGIIVIALIVRAARR